MELIDVSANDFCLFPSFELKLHKQGLTWVGGENRDTAAAINNGCGKTSLFKAIPWCLYGDTIDGERGDKVIRKGAKSARVSVRLRDESGGIWTVTRERRKGSPSLQLIQPDGKAFPSSKDDLQEKIINMVGLDFKAFKNTILYGQNDTARFAAPETKDADRKDTLHRAMRTDVLKDCHKWALERGRALKSEMSTIEVEMSKLEERASEHDLEAIREDHERFELERATAIERHMEQARTLRDRAKAEISTLPAFETTMGDMRPMWKKQLDVLNGKLVKAHEAKKDIEVLRETKVKPLAVRCSEQIKLRATAEVDMRLATEKFNGLKGTICPVCTAPLNGEYASKHKGELKAAFKAAETAHAKAESVELAMRKELEKAEAEVEELQELADQSSDLYRQIDRLKTNIASFDRQEASQKADAEKASERAKHHAEQAKREVALAKEWEGRDNPHAERFDQARAKIKALKAERNSLKLKLDEKSKELAHVEFWVRGFGNQGLPSFMLDNVMPYLTERANHYLETLADGDIQMRFATQRELKSAKGEVRDEIDISWVIEDSEGYPPSGGQRKKMEIATDLALMDLVSEREGGSLDLLLMDEVLDGLDSEGRQRVLSLLHEMRTRRGSIFVISQEAEVAEIFEKSIMVIKEGGESRAEKAA